MPLLNEPGLARPKFPEPKSWNGREACHVINCSCCRWKLFLAEMEKNEVEQIFGWNFGLISGRNLSVSNFRFADFRTRTFWTIQRSLSKSQSSRIKRANIGFLRPEASSEHSLKLLPTTFRVTRFLKQSNPKCIIDGVTLIKWVLSSQSTEQVLFTSKTVIILRKPRY